MQRGIELVDAFFILLEANEVLETYCKTREDVYARLETSPPIVWASPTYFNTTCLLGSQDWTKIDKAWKRVLKELTKDRSNLSPVSIILH